MQAYCEGTELNLESAEESSIQYVGTNSNMCGHKSTYLEGCFVRTGNADTTTSAIFYTILLIKN